MQRLLSVLLDDIALSELVLSGASAQRICDVLDENTQSPSLFRRLLLLSGVRNSRTEAVADEGCTQVRSPERNRALEDLHLQLFMNWLEFSLEQQTADVRVHLNLTPPQERRAVINKLLEVGERSMPAGARPPERQLFLQDLKMVQNSIAA